MVHKGYTPLGKLFISSREKGRDGLPHLSVTLNNGIVNRDSLDRKTETNIEADSHLLAKKGDIAYNMMRIWQGALGLVKYDGLVSPAYVILKPTSFMDSSYAEYLFKSKRLIYLFWAYSYGLTNDRLRLYYKDFAKIQIIVLPIQEQRKIAQILSTWDKAISATEALIANSQQQKKSLMQQLLTGKKRFSGFDKPWNEVKLGDVGKCITGLTYSPSDTVPNGGMLVLRSSNIQNGRLAFDDNVFVTSDLKVKFKTQDGDILICVRNGSKNLIGKSALIKGKAVNQAHGAFMTLFRCDCSQYIFQLFQTNAYYRQVNKNLGATINSINISDLHKFKFLMPTDKKEISAISECLTNADKEIEHLKQQLADLKQEKKALMQQLLTGKRRVNV